VIQLRGVLPIKTNLYNDAKAVMVLQRFATALGAIPTRAMSTVIALSLRLHLLGSVFNMRRMPRDWQSRTL
jgi:predicted ferric reductase